jgi:DNA helicase-2/ATP-dependent DNA helicase PcrA
LRGKVREELGRLLDGFDRWRQVMAADGHVVMLSVMLDESGYIRMWQQDKSAEAPGRLDNLRELARALVDFETLAGFLDHVSLVMETEENAGDDRAALMTLHGAKGLEFDTVFLPGWEEGLFPNQRSMDEQGLKGLEEERRLAYVGLTRARKNAIISYAANRRIYANWQSSIPSRFLSELPDEHIAQSGSASLARETRIAAPAQFHGGTQFPLVARRPKTIEAWEQPGRAPRADAIEVGARVFHEKFGYGTVTAADDDRLDITFDKAGDKRVLDRFVARA